MHRVPMSSQQAIAQVPARDWAAGRHTTSTARDGGRPQRRRKLRGMLRVLGPR